jgi:enoyl-CoA hydratase
VKLVSFQTIRYETSDNGIATITLDQPEKRNALSDEVLGELIGAFEAARDDVKVRVVVLTSSHDRVFSAGGNLAGFADERTLVEKHYATSKFVRLFSLIADLDKPSICAANGHVLAGSLGVALACDLIIAKEEARFGTPEIKVGVFPFMVMALLFRNVLRKHANELLLLGEQISAHEAKEIGLVNKVVPSDEFEAVVEEYAVKLASKSPLLMKMGKQAMFRQHDMALLDALDFLHSQFTLSFSTEDAQEGLQAFLDKREPVWRGR